MHVLTFSNVLYCSALSTHGMATEGRGPSLSGQPQAPPELGDANAPKQAITTWNHPPTEITKCSWIIFPVQLGPAQIPEDQPNENEHRLFNQRLL